MEFSENDVADADDFRGFCQNASDGQLHGIFLRESRANRPFYAMIAKVGCPGAQDPLGALFER